MKKIVLFLVTLLVLAFSAVASAASGKVLDAEEAIVAKFIAGGNFKAVSPPLERRNAKELERKIL